MTRVSPSNLLTTGRWVIDRVCSSLEFTVGHFRAGTVLGGFSDFAGDITVDRDGTASVSAVIQVGSVATGNAVRDKMIKTGGFFAVKTYPTATFVSTAAAETGTGYSLEGQLTIRDVTRPIRLDVAVGGVTMQPGRGEVAHFTASVSVDRREFGVNGGLPAALDGFMVGREVAIKLSIEAVRIT